MLVKAATGAAALAGAATAATNGPDLAGIALLITAISGLIATLGGLILAFRRKPADATDAALLAIAKRLTEGDSGDK